MPFGVDKDLGGDNHENTKFMEKCMERMMSTGKDKTSAIKICKAQMKKNKAALQIFSDQLEEILIEDALKEIV